MTVPMQHAGPVSARGEDTPRTGAAAAARFDALARSIEEERRIVLEMSEALADQRAGVSRDDALQVESSLEHLSRCMNALHEARGARLALVAAACGRADQPLDRLHETVGHALPQRLESARVALREAATRVAREVTINHAVLGRAVEAGESFLQALFSSVAVTVPVYRAGERADAREGGPGVLLDRKA